MNVHSFTSEWIFENERKWKFKFGAQDSQDRGKREIKKLKKRDQLTIEKDKHESKSSGSFSIWTWEGIQILWNITHPWCRANLYGEL